MKSTTLDSSVISHLWFHLRILSRALKYSSLSKHNSKSIQWPSQRYYHHNSNTFVRKLHIKVFENDSNFKSIHTLRICRLNEVGTGLAAKFHRSLPRLNNQLSAYSDVSTSSNLLLTLPTSSLNDLNDDKLLELYSKLTQQRAQNEIQNDSYLEALHQLDDECIRRAASWNFTEFVDFLRRYSSVRVKTDSKPAFLMYAMNRRIESALEAPLPILLEYLRILNNAKLWFDYRKSKQLLQDLFYSHFDQLSWDDIEVFLEPLDCQRCILANDTLKKKICRKLIDEFDNVTSICLTRVFRIFYTQTLFPKNFLFITPWLLHIFDALAAKIDSFHFECVTSAGLLCTKMFIYDARLLKAIADGLLRNLHDLSQAQVATAVSVLTYFNYQHDCRNIYTDIVAALEEDKLFTKFCCTPRYIMQIFSDLSLVGVYSYKYLNVIFSDQFQRSLLHHKLNKYRVTPELFMLYGNSSLECPQYTGTRLEIELFDLSLLKRSYELPACLRKPKKIENIRSESMPSCLNASRNISTFYRVLYCTRGLLDELFGGVQYTHICFLLPQFKRATIIFSLDADGRPIKIPEEFRKKRIVGSQLLKMGMDWYAFTFKSRNIYTNDEAMLMGDEIAKDRMLRQCGLKIISITQHGWLKKSIEDKLNILRDEISKQAGVDLKKAEITS